MSLLTSALIDKLKAAGEDGEKPLCKLFTPDGAATWVLFGMEDDGDTLWCVADLGMDCIEFGTVSLQELESVRGPSGLPVERDKWFDPDKYSLTDLLGRDSLAGV